MDMTKDKYLKQYTGYDSNTWVRTVQTLIQDSGDWRNETHPECDVRKWMRELTQMVNDAVVDHATDDESYDENIRIGSCLAVILTCWSVRIARAKTHDPRRPVKLRKKSAKRVRRMAAAIHDAVFDETQDADYFDQPWEYPYMDNATDGDFV